MKRFKQYLEEAGAGYVSTDHYDVYELVFNYGMIGSGYPLFPFYGKRQERIQGKIKKVTAYHVTSGFAIDGLNDLKGGSKTGSFFTRSTGGILAGAATDGGVLVQVKARPVLSAMEDIFSEIDKQGRRWVSASYFSDDEEDLQDDLVEHMNEFIDAIREKYPNLPEEFDDLTSGLKRYY